MARLPQPGGDSGNWGTILNDYLAQSHKNDGALKDNTVTANVLAPNSVTNAAIATDAVNASSIANESITETLLDQTLQAKLNESVMNSDPSTTAMAFVVDEDDMASNSATKIPTQQSVVAYIASQIGALPATAPAATGVDDTGTLQALIDAASTQGGGTVVLRSGQTYLVTGLVMKTSVILDLNGSTVRLVNNTNASVIATEGYASLIGSDSTNGPRDWSIRNGTLDGNKANQSGTPSSFPAVLAIYGRRYTLDNLLVCNGYGTGIDSQWSTTSPFQGPNGFESWVTRVYVHSCKYDGINFRGPHDTFFQNFFIVKCGDEAGAVPLRFPDSSGRANGTNVDKFHIYGGNGYSYGLVANTAGMRFSNFVIEGSQVAQVLMQASQVMLDGFHLYTGGIATASAKGIQVGDAVHAGLNALTIRGRIENCGGGAMDVTYMGWNNDIDIHHAYFASVVPNKMDLGFVGTLVSRNQIRLRTQDSGTGSGGTYAPTAAQVGVDLGPRRIVRSTSADTADLLQIRDEAGVPLSRVDWRGRRRVVTAGPIPTVAVGTQAGTGATVTITGDDTAGRVTVTTGSNPSAGGLANVTFSGVFGNAPFVVLTAGDPAAAVLNGFATKATTNFTLRCTGTPAASTPYTWDYMVVGA